MLHRILFAVLSASVILSAQSSFPHESEHHSVTTEILEELQALREDLDVFIVPRDVSGKWSFSTDCSTVRGGPPTGTGNPLTWVEQAYRVLGVVPTLNIKQNGTHLVMTGTKYLFGGWIYGEHISYTRLFSVESTNAAFSEQGLIIGRGTVLSPDSGQIRLTEHLELVRLGFDENGTVINSRLTETCTGVLTRTSQF